MPWKDAKWPVPARVKTVLISNTQQDRSTVGLLSKFKGYSFNEM